MRVLSPGRTPPAAVTGKLISDDFSMQKIPARRRFKEDSIFLILHVLLKIAVSINTVIIL